jgi:hypothetical protein
MAYSGILRRVALVRTDVSEELSASIIRVTRIGELGTTLAVTSVSRFIVKASIVPSSPILVTLMMEALNCSETSVLTRAIRRNITENAILQYLFASKFFSHISIIWDEDTTPIPGCTPPSIYFKRGREIPN